MSFLTFRHSCVSETVDGDSLGILGGGGGTQPPHPLPKSPSIPTWLLLFCRSQLVGVICLALGLPSFLNVLTGEFGAQNWEIEGL